MWKDKKVQAEFRARSQERLQALAADLEDKTGVVAIEPQSGDYFVGATLGKANAAAYQEYPDVWVYFVRLDNPEAAIALPTW
jgi:glutathione S-transferase